MASGERCAKRSMTPWGHWADGPWAGASGLVMSRPGALSNLEALSRISEAVRTTGEPPEELVWPDVEIHEHELLDAPLHQGLAGWRRWVADWAASFPEWQTERLESVELDDRRILTIHRIWARGRSTGGRSDLRPEVSCHASRSTKSGARIHDRQRPR
jgi:hypothetical protein